MWLVPRHSRGLTLRTPVPDVVRDALVRWYEGEGSEADHRASVTMVTKARTHGQWIACSCMGDTDPPPLMSAAYLSEAETYYLRRLTSKRQRRPELRAGNFSVTSIHAPAAKTPERAALGIRTA